MSSILGIGLDLIDLAHFQTHYGEASPELLARCFTTRELNDAGSGVNRIARLAARFAAKEATLKALGGGVGVALTDIELLHDESGAPRLELRGAARDIAEQRGVGHFHVSLSHSASSSAAVVIAVSKAPT
jgi:holo-[acyl-carrier protein] synthase